MGMPYWVSFANYSELPLVDRGRFVLTMLARIPVHFGSLPSNFNGLKAFLAHPILSTLSRSHVQRASDVWLSESGWSICHLSSGEAFADPT